MLRRYRGVNVEVLDYDNSWSTINWYGKPERVLTRLLEEIEFVHIRVRAVANTTVMEFSAASPDRNKLKIDGYRWKGDENVLHGYDDEGNHCFSIWKEALL